MIQSSSEKFGRTTNFNKMSSAGRFALDNSNFGDDIKGHPFDFAAGWSPVVTKMVENDHPRNEPTSWPISRKLSILSPANSDSNDR